MRREEREKNEEIRKERQTKTNEWREAREKDIV